MKNKFIILLFLFNINSVFAQDIKFKTPLNVVEKNNSIYQAINNIKLKNPRILLNNKTKKIVARILETEIVNFDNSVELEKLVQKQSSEVSKFYNRESYNFEEFKNTYFSIIKLFYTKNNNCFKLPDSSDYTKDDFEDYCYQYSDKKHVDIFVNHEFDTLYRNLLLNYFLYNTYQKYYDLKLYANDKELLSRLEKTDVIYINTDYLYPIFDDISNTKQINTLLRECGNQNSYNQKNECIENYIISKFNQLTTDLQYDEIKNLIKNLKLNIYKFVKSITPSEISNSELLKIQEQLYNEFLMEYFWYDLLSLLPKIQFYEEFFS